MVNNGVIAAKIAANAVTTDKIADEAVTLAKLPHGTPAPNGTAGKFLRANNGADPTFEHIPNTQTLTYPNDGTAVTTSTQGEVQVNGKLVFDTDNTNTHHISFDGPTSLSATSDFTLPEDGSNGQFLKTNGSGVLSFGDIPAGVGGATGADFNDNVKIRFGDSNDLEIYHAAGDSKIEHTTSGTDLRLITSGGGDDILMQPADDFLVQVAGATKNSIICRNDGATELYYQGNSSGKRLETTETGVSIINTNSPQTSASSSANDLVVSGDGTMGVTLHTNSTNSACNIYFSDTGSAYAGALTYMHNHNQIRMNVNNNYSAPVMQWNSDLTIYFQNTMYSNSTGSDLRMKSNLVKFTNTLDDLKSINGYKFDIKNSTTGTTRKSAGLIAQEVEKIYPDFVVENPETKMKSLEYNTFIGVLVEAVKELTTKVETLEAKVAALEAK